MIIVVWYGHVRITETYLNKKPKGYLLRLWLKFVVTNAYSHGMMIIYIFLDCLFNGIVIGFLKLLESV